MTDHTQQTVQLELRGERARKGIELDSLERFIDKFRDALRDFERSATERSYQIGRGGQPDSRSVAVTSFRLVGFKIGSAILELADPSSEIEDGALPVSPEGSATRNLSALLEAINRSEVDQAVVDKLDDARRALGEHGTFLIRAPRLNGEVNLEVINRLRASYQSSSAHPTPMTVYGTLHLIASEKYRVEIRATDNYNWSCKYDPDLEQKVLPLIKKRVWAHGNGVRERVNQGSLDIEDLGPLPEYESTTLFTAAPVSIDDLLATQHITGPQGLASLGSPGLSESDIDSFLAVTLK